MKGLDPKLFNNSKYPLYVVSWKDAVSESSWEDPEKVKQWAEKDYIVQNIGWVVCQTKKYLVVCSEVTEDMDFGNKTKIPIGWIVNKQLISVEPKKGGK